MIRDQADWTRGIHADGDGRGVRVVIQYGSNHRGSVVLGPAAVLELIRDLSAAVTR